MTSRTTDFPRLAERAAYAGLAAAGILWMGALFKGALPVLLWGATLWGGLALGAVCGAGATVLSIMGPSDPLAGETGRRLSAMFLGILACVVSLSVTTVPNIF